MRSPVLRLVLPLKSHLTASGPIASAHATAATRPSAQASMTIELDLQPGSYLLICNVPYHYAAGMVIAFTVSG